MEDTAFANFSFLGVDASEWWRNGLSMLQWPSELDAFLEFMRENQVRSFLEVGALSGRLSLMLRDVLQLEKVAACDFIYSPLLQTAKDVAFFCGNHHDPQYLEWRRVRGHFDMVFIDADHETGFRPDYEIERAFPHRFIAFHDIANRAYPALLRFWQFEVQGRKCEFVNSDRTAKFGVPPVRFPFLSCQTLDEYVEQYGYSCGIGVVGPEER